ncbi:sensor histidine kinase [Brunnivagina elsteri]|uniref:histidine kinase n=1 Tax=Brunnivagina elsteri CCALA 953 TaxID=987040 RepID=A0A2A2TFY4_9CYAN|nr:HAMP domain-containing sensor histidine kinase [Calothrix elsteri]PAX52650.1 sensor histidine kinase [Calothrix elsteri CCALA 953]
MNLNNWIYLAAGLLLGIGFSSFKSNRSKLKSEVLSSVQIDNNSSKNNNVRNQVDREQELLQNIKQTQLAYHLAQEMSQFKAGFLARTTHVLRSPLNGLIGLHQLILEDLCENPEEEREFIEQAHDRAMKLLKLIDEILNVARAEYGTSRLDMQPQPLTELLQEVYDLTYMLAENRNYPFQVQLPEKEIYTTTDVRWLRQVLISLIEATIGQMEVLMEEGRICLSTASVNGTDLEPKINSNNYAIIWLDIPTFAFPSREEIDFMTAEIEVNPKFPGQKVAPGMKLLLSQTMLDVLGGKLEILTYPGDSEDSQQMTRLEISIPLWTAETALVQ